eukprot:2370800-Rhodomonas_salina.3
MPLPGQAFSHLPDVLFPFVTLSQPGGLPQLPSCPRCGMLVADMACGSQGCLRRSRSRQHAASLLAAKSSSAASCARSASLSASLADTAVWVHATRTCPRCSGTDRVSGEPSGLKAASSAAETASGCLWTWTRERCHCPPTIANASCHVWG